MQENNSVQNQADEFYEIDSAKDNAKTFPYAYVRKLRRECSHYRTALRQMQKIYSDIPQELAGEYADNKRRADEFEEQLVRLKEEEERKKLSAKAQKIEKLLKDAAASLDAVEPCQVAALLKDGVGIDDDGRVFVLKAPDMALDSFVSEFLNGNAHLVKSRSGKKGVNTNPRTAVGLSVERISSMTVQQYGQNRDRILKSLTGA